MRKNQKQKIMAILALCVSAVGLAIGFAAFSNTLTISSSATVTPDKLDFDINVYSVPDWKGSEDFTDVSLYTSNSTGVPIEYHSEQTTASAVKISDDGQTVSISNISVDMKEPGDEANYVFMLKNEGQYDAYMDTSALERYYTINGTCTPGEGTTPEFVSSACNDIRIGFEFATSNGDGVEQGTAFKLPKGDYVFLWMVIDYYVEDYSGHIRADGPFSISFPDVNFSFSTVA